jgi:outer membrane biogenesis lipoprotein LolB
MSQVPAQKRSLKLKDQGCYDALANHIHRAPLGMPIRLCPVSVHGVWINGLSVTAREYTIRPVYTRTLVFTQKNKKTNSVAFSPQANYTD